MPCHIYVYYCCWPHADLMTFFLLILKKRFPFNGSQSIRCYWRDCSKWHRPIWKDVICCVKHRKKSNCIWTTWIVRPKMCRPNYGDAYRRRVQDGDHRAKSTWSTLSYGKWQSICSNGIMTRCDSPSKVNCCSPNRTTTIGERVAPLNWLLSSRCWSPTERYVFFVKSV